LHPFPAPRGEGIAKPNRNDTKARASVRGACAVSIGVIGATGPTGRSLVVRLLEDGHDVVAIARSPARLAAFDPRVRRRVVDLDADQDLRSVLSDLDTAVVSVPYPHHQRVLRDLPRACRVVFLSSTRRFSRFPSAAAETLRATEDCWLNSGRTGALLHVAMIYGPPGDRNISRLIALIEAWPRWLPMAIPLPSGGRALVQPVFREDVVDAVCVALERCHGRAEVITVAGPRPLAMRDVMGQLAACLGRKVWVLSLPDALLIGAARAGAALGLVDPGLAPQLRRLSENKAFDVSAMERRLGINARPFAEGARRTIEARRLRAPP